MGRDAKGPRLLSPLGLPPQPGRDAVALLDEWRHSLLNERCKMSSSASRGRLLRVVGATGTASATGFFIGASPARAAAVAPARADIETLAHPFELGQVRLSASR